MLYRIYTEDRENLPSLANAYFAGYSLYKGVGYWRGQEEKSAVIEVVTDDSKEEANAVECLARSIRLTNHQESVLVISLPCQSKFIND